MNNSIFVPLNLPSRLLKLGRNASGQLVVYDSLRHKWLVLTPEEWVRQHIVAHLVSDLGYPASLMANEVGLKLNGLQRRCDTVVWRAGAISPLMIVEYKAPGVNVTQQVFDQIARYNMVLRAACLLVTNGMTHYCCVTGKDGSVSRYLDHIPSYKELLSL